MGLTKEQTEIIKATVPVVQEHGFQITKTFYGNMLRERPELNAVFNTTHQVTGHQARALAGSLYAYAANIENLEVLAPDVKLIAHKHASLFIRPEQYNIVGEYLLAAMKQVLGDACTPEILDAWGAAYWQLAHILIDEEDKLYRQSEDWKDWRQLRIAKKVPESEEITSFYLEPVDESPLPGFRPGQYISVRVLVPGLKYPQARQYSLSDSARPEYYRISVKKELGLDTAAPGAATHPGYVSNLLHSLEEGNALEVSHPFGDFFLLDDDNASPVVLLSAGVGLTPLISILNTLVSQKTSADQKIHFIHGARRASNRAFKDHVRSVAKAHPNLKVTFFASSPSSNEEQGVDYDHAGRVELQKLEKKDLFLDNKRTTYYVCGPEEFMVVMLRSLVDRGVDPSQIKMELFGTGGVRRDADLDDLQRKSKSKSDFFRIRLNPTVVAPSVLLATVAAGLGLALYGIHAKQPLWQSLSLWSIAGVAMATAVAPTVKSS
ncbi:hypothetical protein V1525DRAFT_233273 [Lipomyces kononenkoae]|uniref:Uncharacterized protein n=1 Tax=Lipomyces kononenkoae TaxID=34357 RepID=A0ACC3SXR5_LIPKO